MHRLKPDTNAKKWGLGIFLFASFTIINGLAGGRLLQPVEAIAPLLLMGLGLFLWLSEIPSDFFDKRRVAKQRNAENSIQSILASFPELSGARLVVAYERLEAIVRKAYKQSAPAKLSELIESVGFDVSRLESKFLGSVTNFSNRGFGDQIRIYKDWVIAGSIGYDFDVSTRGEVTQSGSVHYGKNNQKIDDRHANLVLATQEWSVSFEINPNHADEARRILSQLLAIVEQSKPKAVSATEMAESMERLMNSSGKSPAEKLEELSNLRYQRLLTDKEFEQAKARILDL